MVGMVRIACQRSADLARNHVQRFLLVIREMKPLGRRAHGGFEEPRRAGLVREVSMRPVPFVECRIDRGHTGLLWCA